VSHSLVAWKCWDWMNLKCMECEISFVSVKKVMLKNVMNSMQNYNLYNFSLKRLYVYIINKVPYN